MIYFASYMNSFFLCILPWIPGCWRPLLIRNMVQIGYVLLIIQALLYALQNTIWSLLEVGISLKPF